jgi:uncharacterized protein (TIGR00369 family)
VTAVSSALAHARRAPETTRERVITWQDPLASASQAAGIDGLTYMRRIAGGEVPPPPIAVLLRMQPVELAFGRAVFEGEPGEEHYNPIGVVHGGYASTLLDTVLGCAVQSTLDPGQAYTTQTIEVKLLRPITRETGTVEAVGEITYRGRRQATAEARILDANGKVLATGTSTCMVL